MTLEDIQKLADETPNYPQLSMDEIPMAPQVRVALDYFVEQHGSPLPMVITAPPPLPVLSFYIKEKSSPVYHPTRSQRVKNKRRK